MEIRRFKRLIEKHARHEGTGTYSFNCQILKNRPENAAGKLTLPCFCCRGRWDGDSDAVTQEAAELGKLLDCYVRALIATHRS